ncbi:hypothetical protein [Streptomyces fungicidicus]|uniref:Uncharacterized protein n=1 Tax=Streptomyces fungicidicus TaxID=68203 RepID=A0ACC7Y8N2_9ACTN|nr:hypothetical protein [Streptomyces fungicidicus]NUV77925.1 hypothetical protein [Streptomyces fungicidicus]
MSASLAPAQSIAATTAALQEELPQLEQLQQELEKELAAVSERVLSVRTALTALLALAEIPTPRGAQATPEPAVAKDETVVEAATLEETGPVPAPRKAATTRAAGARKTMPAETTRRKERSSTKKPRTTTASRNAAPVVKNPAGFTEQVIGILARSPETAMRARDVAQALGRDSSVGSVNAVRSTLDRLVATSRAARAGRGLYQAAAAS